MFGNVNKVMLMGRLTRDPEMRTFTNGGKVASFGFAVNNRKKNNTTGEWEDDPMFIDCKVFNRGEFGKLADHAQQYLGKGKLAFLEGHLVLEKWESEGQKRSKHVVVIDNFQVLDSRQDGERGSSGGSRFAQSSAAPSSQDSGPDDGYDSQESHLGVASAPPQDDIPF